MTNVTTKPHKVPVPTFEIADCPMINLNELREKGLDCLIRNEAMVDGKRVVFAPPKTIRESLKGLDILLQAYRRLKD